jgi:hypothetical protein
VKICRYGRRIEKYFTDGRFGSKRKALEAAMLHRDTISATISSAEYAIWKRNVKRPDNKTGVVGVGRYIRREKTSHGIWECPVWEAFWHDADNERKGLRFSVCRYGEGQAKRLACKARREVMAEVERELLRRESLLKYVTRARRD